MICGVYFMSLESRCSAYRIFSCAFFIFLHRIWIWNTSGENESFFPRLVETLNSSRRCYSDSWRISTVNALPLQKQHVPDLYTPRHVIRCRTLQYKSQIMHWTLTSVIISVIIIIYYIYTHTSWSESFLTSVSQNIKI